MLRVGFVIVVAALAVVIIGAVAAFCMRKRVDVVSPRHARSGGQVWRGGASGGNEMTQPGDRHDQMDIDLEHVDPDREEFVVDHVYSRPRPSFHGSLMGDADRENLTPVGEGANKSVKKSAAGGEDLDLEHLKLHNSTRFTTVPAPPPMSVLGEPTPEKSSDPKTLNKASRGGPSVGVNNSSMLLAAPATPAAPGSKMNSPMSFAIVDIDVDEVADKTLSLDEEQQVLAALGNEAHRRQGPEEKYKKASRQDGGGVGHHDDPSAASRSAQMTPVPYVIEVEPATSPQVNVGIEPDDEGKQRSKARLRAFQQQQQQRGGLLSAAPYKPPAPPVPKAPAQNDENNDDIEFAEEEDIDDRDQQDDDQLSLQFTVEVGVTPRPQDSLAPTPRRSFTPRPEDAAPEISDIDTDDVVE